MTGEIVYVLLPVHNRRDTTEQFLHCLAKQTYPHIQLILVDDGSTDDTSGVAKKYFPHLTLLTGTGHWWWAGSLQEGYKWLQNNARAASDVILIINDDTTFEADFVENAVRTLRGRSQVLLLANLYSQQTGEYVEAGVRVDWKNLSFVGVKDPEKINCFSTRGLFFRVEDFAAIGAFHPFLLPHYGSDYEFTLRAFRIGFTPLSIPGVKLWLNESTTGVRALESLPPMEFLKLSFSKRTTQNPLYWTTFILLACPKSYIPINLGRVWSMFFRGFCHSLRY
jgi:GT2 family glycosyltransferase